MHQYFRWMVLPLSAILICLLSCKETVKTQEEAEISQMDSLSSTVRDSTERLEEQTRRVEEGIERLEREFENSN